MMDDPLYIPVADSMQSWVKAIHCMQTRNLQWDQAPAKKWKKIQNVWIL